MKLYLSGLFFLGLITLSGCIGDLVGKGTEELAELELGEGDMSARIDGRDFNGRIAWAERSEDTSGIDLSVLRIIGGEIRGEEDGEAIALVLLFGSATVPSTATARLSEDCLDNGEPCIAAMYGLSDRSGEIQTNFEADYLIPNSRANISYEIYDRGDRMAVRGTFDLVLVSDEDDDLTMRVSNGTFDAPFQE